MLLSSFLRAGRVRIVVPLVAVVALVAGCRSLPDVQPFADATSAMASSIKTAGATAVKQVERIEGARQRAIGQAPSTPIALELYDGWARRDQLFSALEDYSQSLANLVRAGNDGQASAKKLAESVSTLAKSVGGVFPAGEPAAELVTGLAQQFYGMVVKEVAAHRLHKAIEYSNPTIRAIADLVARDLQELRDLNEQARQQQFSELARKSTSLPTVRTLESKRVELAKGVNPDGTLKIIEDPATRSKIKELSEMLAQEIASPDYVQYTTKRASVVAEHDAADALLEQAVYALDAWAKAHEAIGYAVEKRRAPSLAELERITSELLTTYQTYKLQKAKGG